MAINSMTGFGRAAEEDGGVRLEVEIRSVNHRFLDISVKLPSLYSSAEYELQKTAREKLLRGRIEVSVIRAAISPAGESVARFNKPLFFEQLKLLEQGLEAAGIADPHVRAQGVLAILARREIFDLSQAENSLDREQELLRKTALRAFEDLITMREREGRALEQETLRLLSELSAIVEKVKDEAVVLPEQYQERLNSRLAKLRVDAAVEAERIAQEVALFADRVDITEEIARLLSHIEQFKGLLSEGSSGRKLEFLLQEMMRELNTAGTKAQSASISRDVVEGKALLEKLREQVQNIE